MPFHIKSFMLLPFFDERFQPRLPVFRIVHDHICLVLHGSMWAMSAGRTWLRHW